MSSYNTLRSTLGRYLSMAIDEHKYLKYNTANDCLV